MMNGMTTKTTFPSNCHLPIFQDNPRGGLERYTDIWSNFYHDTARRTAGDTTTRAKERISEYNGRVINGVIVFDSERDKTWFILRWS